jgi:acetylornithine deacetylase/succinyl-diaminopimelate desuccinylase-like protein
MLEHAHKPDEYVVIDDLVTSAKVMALAAWSLLHRTA